MNIKNIMIAITIMIALCPLQIMQAKKMSASEPRLEIINKSSSRIRCRVEYFPSSKMKDSSMMFIKPHSGEFFSTFNSDMMGISWRYDNDERSQYNARLGIKKGSANVLKIFNNGSYEYGDYKGKAKRLKFAKDDIPPL